MPGWNEMNPRILGDEISEGFGVSLAAHEILTMVARLAREDRFVDQLAILRVSPMYNGRESDICVSVQYTHARKSGYVVFGRNRSSEDLHVTICDHDWGNRINPPLLSDMIDEDYEGRMEFEHECIEEAANAVVGYLRMMLTIVKEECHA